MSAQRTEAEKRHARLVSRRRRRERRSPTEAASSVTSVLYLPEAVDALLACLRDARVPLGLRHAIVGEVLTLVEDVDDELADKIRNVR